MNEQDLEKKYLNQYVKFDYPGKEPVYGKVDRIAIEHIQEPLVVLKLDNDRYECSPEDLEDCLTLLKPTS